MAITWQLQDAKQHFSEVVRAAQTGEPQVITKHGREVAVVIEYEGYRRAVEGGRGLKELCEAAPFPDDFEFSERRVWPERFTGLED
ncbi:MAG: type II toxin-antitoxin system Phd/YefM family antitoxin [Leucobacter sp.]